MGVNGGLGVAAIAYKIKCPNCGQTVAVGTAGNIFYHDLGFNGEYYPHCPASWQPAPNFLKKNPHAVALGRLGGKKGGKARAAKLTKKRRVEIATKAANARWDNGRA
jgi:hypothetical protein